MGGCFPSSTWSTGRMSEKEFESLNEMWSAGVGVEVLPHAQRLLADRLGVPFS